MSTTFGIVLESGKMKARRRRRRTKRVTNGFARIGVGKFSESSSANPFPPRRPQWLGCSVCFRSVRIDSAKPVMEWFHFSLEENYIMAAAEEQQLTYDQLGGASSRDLVPILDHDVVSGESWTSVGSTIYCVGGLCRDMSAPPGDICSTFSRHVRYFDADYPEDGWKTATPMITPRWKAKVVALHGKLYAFGGCSKGYAPWAEVFTPGDGGQGGHWKPLRSFPSHPSCSSDRIFAVAHESSNKILVVMCNSGVAYEYNVAQKSWFEFKLDLGSGLLYRGPVDCQPVLVDNMMYWVLRGQLNAYDLETRMLFSGPIEDMSIQSFLNCRTCDDDDDDDNDYPSVPSLLHLAEDDFCFLYMSSYIFHCVTLRVSKGINPDGAGSLRASVLSCQSFGFEYPSCFLDALLL